MSGPTTSSNTHQVDAQPQAKSYHIDVQDGEPGSGQRDIELDETCGGMQKLKLASIGHRAAKATTGISTTSGTGGAAATAAVTPPDPLSNSTTSDTTTLKGKRLLVVDDAVTTLRMVSDDTYQLLS